ncbi:MAG: lipoate--protein ligase family protein [Gammaproteobacteria bacterium]|nr:lipoate--protein ligase family protein [Gammaproteobacteria bacterium]
MPVNWRLLSDSEVLPDSGLALDDALTRSASEWGSPTLRLYTYTPCVLVGRFQHVPNEVNLEHCQSMGIPINRRPSGGGAIIMGPDQLGIALIVPNQTDGFAMRSSDLMHQCASGLIRALEKLGISAKFQGKNDLVADNRKIAGLGLYQPNSSGRLFHASLLLDLNIKTMLKLLRAPFDSTEASTNRYSAVSKRITTVRSSVGTDFSMSELIETVRAGYEDEFGVRIESQKVNSSEQQLADHLVETQYSTTEWIYRDNAPVLDYGGQSSIRTGAGDLEIKVITAGDTLKSVFLSGNFITSDNAVHDLESSLRWHTSEPRALKQTIAKSMKQNAKAWDRISEGEITTTLLRALNQSDTSNSNLTAGSCFGREIAEVV